MQGSLGLVDLGRSDYLVALNVQRKLHRDRLLGAAGDSLILTEHEPVITLGRNAGWANIRASKARLIAQGLRVVQVERGGDVTYHGPGQLVAYPVIDLREAGIGVRSYIALLEQTAINLLARHGVAGERRAELRGIWVGERKLASIGVYVSHSVTMHGIAINVCNDLAPFDLIHPCGLAGQRMTSIAEESAATPPMHEVKRAYASIVAAALGTELTQSATLSAACIT